MTFDDFQLDADEILLPEAVPALGSRTGAALFAALLLAALLLGRAGLGPPARLR